ncbi:MAG: hypothetical protein UR26_C0001G0204 [candidate division TM6 bacterium GW2011_GWF2_32_72]|nr:MAG: hypothetical protein UR26_C0001G0204 [candidate division TM6 bacterium GW2011_GWF2_32_72]
MKYTSFFCLIFLFQSFLWAEEGIFVRGASELPERVQHMIATSLKVYEHKSRGEYMPGEKGFILKNGIAIKKRYISFNLSSGKYNEFVAQGFDLEKILLGLTSQFREFILSINLSNNQLNELPKGWHLLESLQYIYLNNNNLTSLNNLNDLKFPSSLYSITIVGNNFKGYDLGWIAPEGCNVYRDTYK